MSEEYRRIGQGFCGSVWAEPDSSIAIKREDGGPGRSLYNDYVMHQRTLQTLRNSPVKVKVPSCYQYTRGDDQSWWHDQLQWFPRDFQIPCNILVTDRIPPFPKAVRDTIVDLYCPETLKMSIKSSEPDQDCLIRPYLGRRRRLEKQSMFKAFSLRNFSLHVDQMEDLDLDVMLYARIMAETLAYMYWRANIDANDLEFVLAPRASENRTSDFGDSGVFSFKIESNYLGDHAVWILDFDCCRHMPCNETGVNQAVAAFYRNDPYFPHPGREDVKDQLLWSEFKNKFLDVSNSLLEQGSPEASLPSLWIELAEQKGRPRKDASDCDASGLSP